MDRGELLTPLLAQYLQRKFDVVAVSQCGRTSGPKYGQNLHDIATSMNALRTPFLHSNDVSSLLLSVLVLAPWDKYLSYSRIYPTTFRGTKHYRFILQLYSFAENKLMNRRPYRDCFVGFESLDRVGRYVDWLPAEVFNNCMCLVCFWRGACVDGFTRCGMVARH